MQSKYRNTKAREKKIEGMRKIKEAYEIAEKAGKIKRYKISECLHETGGNPFKKPVTALAETGNSR